MTDDIQPQRSQRKTGAEWAANSSKSERFVLPIMPTLHLLAAVAAMAEGLFYVVFSHSLPVNVYNRLSIPPLWRDYMSQKWQCSREKFFVHFVVG